MFRWLLPAHMQFCCPEVIVIKNSDIQRSEKLGRRKRRCTSPPFPNCPLYSSWMSSRPRSSSLSRVRTFFIVLLLPLRELRFEPRDKPVPLLCLECAASSAAAKLPVRGEEEELEWWSCLPPPERRRRMTRPPSLSELLSSS